MKIVNRLWTIYAHTFMHKKNPTRFVGYFLEASPRLELGVRILQTLALPLGYDAISALGDALRSMCGAGDGIRTRDFHLGKVTLYH